MLVLALTLTLVLTLVLIRIVFVVSEFDSAILDLPHLFGLQSLP